MASSSTPFHECRTYYLKSGTTKISEYAAACSLESGSVALIKLIYQHTRFWPYNDQKSLITPKLQSGIVLHESTIIIVFPVCIT
ncbi:hypothetical protein VCRA2119O48_1160002 [Vibrio crassostreae]|nr:hypothetical protein VCRA2119O48_1160002 [Vibrio crassostreae]CAK3757615.1 hypothetical protein VCRA212O16_1240002 [Vibrio crassostreae]